MICCFLLTQAYLKHVAVKVFFSRNFVHEKNVTTYSLNTELYHKLEV